MLLWPGLWRRLVLLAMCAPPIADPGFHLNNIMFCSWDDCGENSSQLTTPMTCHLGDFLLDIMTSEILLPHCWLKMLQRKQQYNLLVEEEHLRVGMDFCSKGHVDVRVFHPNASSCYTSKPHTHGKVKTREYGKHIREAEHGLFTPLLNMGSSHPFIYPPLVHNSWRSKTR